MNFGDKIKVIVKLNSTTKRNNVTYTTGANMKLFNGEKIHHKSNFKLLLTRIQTVNSDFYRIYTKNSKYRIL